MFTNLLRGYTPLLAASFELTINSGSHFRRRTIVLQIITTKKVHSVVADALNCRISKKSSCLNLSWDFPGGSVIALTLTVVFPAANFSAQVGWLLSGQTIHRRSRSNSHILLRRRKAYIPITNSQRTTARTPSTVPSSQPMDNLVLLGSEHFIMLQAIT